MMNTVIGHESRSARKICSKIVRYLIVIRAVLNTFMLLHSQTIVIYARRTRQDLHSGIELNLG
jgi:hypothetical protein